MKNYFKDINLLFWRPVILFALVHLLFFTIIFFIFIFPIYSFFLDRHEKIYEQRSILARYESVAGQEAQVEIYSKKVSEINANGELIVGASEGIATASLQDTLNSLAQQAHTTVRSIQMLPKKTIGPVSLIGARIEISGSFENTYHFYKIIEEASPTLIVDRVDIITLPSMPPQSMMPPFPRPNVQIKEAPSQPINAQLDIYAGAVTRSGR